jgi:hypothetical protein
MSQTSVKIRPNITTFKENTPLPSIQIEICTYHLIFLNNLKCKTDWFVI